MARFIALASIKIFVMGLVFLVSSCGQGQEQKPSLKKEEAFIHYELGMDYFGIGEQNKAVDEWRRAVELDPDSEAHHMLGYDYFLKGEYEAAEKEWVYMLSKNNNKPTALNNLGNLYKARGRGEEATEYYLKALEINPDIPMAYYNIGTIKSDKGDLESAKENFSKALKLDPQMPTAMHQMGETLLQEGKIEEAKVYFKKLADGEAREDRGFNARLAGYSSLAKMYQLEKNFEEAEKCFLKGIELDPQNPGLRYSLGNMYEDQGKMDAAEKEYLQILAATPGFPYAYNSLGNLYAEMEKNLEKAEQVLMRGMQIDQTLKPHFLDSLGWVYYKQGKIEEALSRIEEAIALTKKEEKKNLASKYYHRGMIYQAKGERTKAREDFNKVIELDPEGESGRKVLKIADLS